VTKEALFKDARSKNGLTEQDYRDEMRRQIIEGKMIQLRVRGRVRITEEDIKTMFDRVVREERKRREYHPSWIVLRILPGASDAAIAERKAQATEIAARARRRARTSPSSRPSIRTTPPRATTAVTSASARRPGPHRSYPGRLRPLGAELENGALPLEPGDISAPLQVGQAVVVMKLVSRQPSRYTTLKEAKNEMIQRLQSEIMDKAKKKWLEELRRKTHVETRL
jgi:peptidyl-prolyl cis-trans isomerase SurA